MVEERILPGGLRFVGEKIPHFRSTAMGIWVLAGSVGEETIRNGISHFIEHMLFKGTENRSAHQLVQEIDAVGGSLNAFTTKEYTCFHVKVMDEHIPLAVDVLLDLLMNPLLEEDAITREKAVVMEEIAMSEDTPEDLVHEILCDSFFSNHSLAMPILGTKETVQQIDRQSIVSYMERWYHPENMVFSIAGNYDSDQVSALVTQRLGKKQWTSFAPKEETGHSLCYAARNIVFREKPIEQVHVSMGFPGLVRGHDDVYAMLALNNVLGGGMSARLFQKIREQQGLAYSVYTYPVSYGDGGLFDIYAGLNMASLPQMLELLRTELEDIRGKGLSVQELAAAKEQMKGNFILGLDSTGNRMSSIGKSILLLGEVRSEEEILRRMNAVTMEDVARVTQSILNYEKMTLALVGPLGNIDEVEGIMKRFA